MSAPVASSNSRFPYRWNIKDSYPESHGHKVFSTFACGGGSTMGYKLAGYDVIGSNDIDPQLAEVYKINHHPKYQYVCPVKDLATIELPKELFELDILDGSPPCSTFSTSGLRDKAWGKEKHFREGQATQVLDDLFFDFLDVVERLQPKIVVAENVAGMLKGNARGYLILIKDRLTQLGYATQIFLLDSSTMGVPQKRNRVFIIANRMNYPKLKMNFNQKPIRLKEYKSPDKDRRDVSPHVKKLLSHMQPADTTLADIRNRVEGLNIGFTAAIISNGDIFPTVTANSHSWVHRTSKKYLTTEEYRIASTFPADYNFNGIKPLYLLGMSVPPVMMAQVANQIFEQWLTK